jgi:hypothetical protein
VVSIGSATLEICIRNFIQFSFVHFASFALFFAKIYRFIILFLQNVHEREDAPVTILNWIKNVFIQR